MLNYVLRKVWNQADAHVDLLVMGGFQKRAHLGLSRAPRNRATLRHGL